MPSINTTDKNGRSLRIDFADVRKATHNVLCGPTERKQQMLVTLADSPHEIELTGEQASDFNDWFLPLLNDRNDGTSKR